MRTPHVADLLAAWDAALALPPARRFQPLLTAAGEAPTVEAFAVGDRDRLLLNLRERLFGQGLRVPADCPACGAALELNFTTADLLAPLAETGRLTTQQDTGPSPVGAATAGSLTVGA